MGRRKKIQYRIAASYDTETTNINEKEVSLGKTFERHSAFVCLYIFADLRDVDLYTYEQGDEVVHLYRTEAKALAYIESLINWGKDVHCIPIVTAYNLMFDMQTIIYALNEKYEMRTSAQSSTNVYTLDLLEDGVQVLRFWDTFHLEMRGLAAMGETCGLPKAKGDWDYKLVRTPKTKLTTKEKFYASRDVQVIPAYLRYLLHANEWLKPEMLGSNVLTKTSLVRQMAKHDIGKIKINDGTVGSNFYLLCKQEMPKEYNQYALRKACFRGAITFTAANYANQIWHNVASLDVTSMHHTFINGRMVPVKFKAYTFELMTKQIEHILSKSMEDVLKLYHKPFAYAIHAKIKFTNIRLRDNTIFSKAGICIIPQAKFRHFTVVNRDNPEPAKVEAYNKVVSEGFVDTALSPRFAYGKLISADEIVLHLTEIELWCIKEVYEFDEYELLSGEGTAQFVLPPDYVTLQSNMLFKMKSVCKKLVNTYEEGVPYKDEISELIPDGIMRAMREGILTNDFLEGYYTSTVKGMFNSIYGTMAQDVYKPDFIVEEGKIQIDKDTVTTEESWEETQPSSCKVLYTYGMRIVGGSRMHLIIAMMLLDNYFGDRIHITGGDTDSVKCACDKDVTDEELLDALQPIYDASKAAIDACQTRVRKNYSNLASDLKGIGGFEVEKAGNTTRYKTHIEYWNKARLSIGYDRKPHVTFAGLSRNENLYNINHAIRDFLQDYTEEEVLENVLGYNVYVDNSICHAFEITMPNPDDYYDSDVMDYCGDTYHVRQHEAKCIYDAGRILGDTLKFTNRCNVEYNPWIYKESRSVFAKDGKVYLCKGTDKMSEILMCSTMHTLKN